MSRWLVLVLVLGCAVDHDTSDVGIAADAGPRPPPMSVTVVIGTFVLSADPAGEAFGFDLDGADGRPASAPAGGCQDRPDVVSPITGAHGVDNSFATLVPTLDGLVMGDGVDGAIQAEIASGALLVLIRIADIDDFAEDASVMVHVALANAQVPMPSATCRAHADRASCLADAASACAWSASTSACSGIAAGQTFGEAMDLGTVVGAIHGGRFQAQVPMLPLLLQSMGHMIPLVLHDARLGGVVAPSGITQGQIGGVLVLAELGPGGEPGPGSFAGAAADMQPEANPTSCDAISFGTSFAAVVANTR